MSERALEPTGEERSIQSDEAAVDVEIFKAIMRKVAGTVTVLSTSSEGDLYGMTATAMCSVCVEPPTILIVVNRSARTHLHIDRTKSFAVSILADEQAGVAKCFASRTPDKFGEVSFDRLADDCPIIANASAYLHCEVSEQFDVGTHTIFIGRVIGGEASDRQPLVYLDGKYGRVATFGDD